MKILVLSPREITTENVIAGLQSLMHHETIVYFYDQHGTPVDSGMIRVAEQHKPDMLCYIGQNGGAFLASESTFHKLKAICPTVAMIHDASDKTWARLLHEYREREAFSCVVNIDGNPDWEHGKRDLTALTPTAQGFFE